MNGLRHLCALIAGGAIAATLLGCGDEKTQHDAAPVPATSPSTSSSAPTGETGKPAEPSAPAEPGKPAGNAPAPAVIEQPAAPTATPSDAAKDKAKTGAGDVKKETPPSGH